MLFSFISLQQAVTGDRLLNGVGSHAIVLIYQAEKSWRDFQILMMLFYKACLRKGNTVNKITGIV
jgi:hypothetical protein